jgi:hypothetical protein
MEQTQLTLTPSEFAEATAKQAFVKEDAESLPAERLLEAVKYALLKDDRPALYLWQRYLPARLNRKPNESDGIFAAADDAVHAAELRRLLSVVRQKLEDDSLIPVAKSASDLMVRAGKLSRSVAKSRQPSMQYVFQAANEVPFK